ncbi:MAG: hypothetical protein HY815_03195 [Candidatus Riflebacteria bacterium]|nr:hypothetical protein [Candidatus Riflebacteria bacterium]
MTPRERARTKGVPGSRASARRSPDQDARWGGPAVAPTRAGPTTTPAQVLTWSQTFRSLVEAGARDGWAHAYLLESDSADGAAFYASALARTINGGVSPSARLALTEVWPLGLAITIAQVQAVIEATTVRFGPDVTKVFVLHAADRMQAPAANALLKTLEEPPERTVFVLATTSSTHVLPTIRSRCRVAWVGLPGDDELARLLQLDGTERDLIGLALAVSGRQPQSLLELLDRRADLSTVAASADLGDLLDLVRQLVRERGEDPTALTPIHGLLAGGWYPLRLVFAVAAGIERLAAEPTLLSALALARPIAHLQDWIETQAEKEAAAKLAALAELYSSGYKHPQLADESKASLAVGRTHAGLILRACQVLLHRALRPGSLLAAGPLARLTLPRLASLMRRCQTLAGYLRQNVAAAHVFDELFLSIRDAIVGEPAGDSRPEPVEAQPAPEVG